MINSEKFISNPINCYLLIKQLTLDSEELFQNIHDKSSDLIGKLIFIASNFIVVVSFKTYTIIKIIEIFIVVSSVSLRSKRYNRIIGIRAKIPRAITVIS